MEWGRDVAHTMLSFYCKHCIKINTVWVEQHVFGSKQVWNLHICLCKKCCIAYDLEKQSKHQYLTKSKRFPKKKMNKVLSGITQPWNVLEIHRQYFYFERRCSHTFLYKLRYWRNFLRLYSFISTFLGLSSLFRQLQIFNASF